MLAAERFGGVDEAVDVGRSPLRLEPVSASFHGRDVFAPVAARLAAASCSLADAGAALDPDELVAARAAAGTRVRTAGSSPTRCSPTATATSCSTPSQRRSRRAAACDRARRSPSTGVRAAYGTTFADVAAGELLLYADGYGAPSLAVNRGSALDTLGLTLDDEILIVRAS